MKHGDWKDWRELGAYLRLQLRDLPSANEPSGDWQQLQQETSSEVVKAIRSFCNAGEWPVITANALFFIRRRLHLACKLTELFAEAQGGLSKNPIPVPFGDTRGGDTAGVLAVLLFNVWSSLASKQRPSGILAA
jgi:hypothetical protein